MRQGLIEQEEACPTPLAAGGADSASWHLPFAPLRIKMQSAANAEMKI